MDIRKKSQIAAEIISELTEIFSIYMLSGSKVSTVQTLFSISHGDSSGCFSVCAGLERDWHEESGIG